jgi:hypothetical protein
MKKKKSLRKCLNKNENEKFQDSCKTITAIHWNACQMGTA